MQINLFLCCFACAVLITRGQLPPGISLSSRRVPQIAPPRIAPTNPRIQQPQQQAQNQGRGGRFYPQNPNFFNPSILARRLNTLETEMRRLSGSVGSIGNNLRVTLSQTLTERLGLLRQEVENYEQRIAGNEDGVKLVQTELKYLKNSNADMQKRIRRLEESRNQHEESIQSVLSALEAFQQDPGPPPGVPDEINSLPPDVSSTEFQKLSEAMKHIEVRMNRSESLAEGHGWQIQSFASDIEIVRQKNEALQAENLATSNSLSEIQGNVSVLQTQISDLLEDDIATTSDDVYDSEMVGDVQPSLDDIIDNVREIERGQQRHLSAIQNLTVRVDSFAANSTATESTSYYDDGDAPPSVVMEMASSVAQLEESVKQIKESKRVEDSDIKRRLAELGSDLSSQQEVISQITIQINDLNNIQGFPPPPDAFNGTVFGHDPVSRPEDSGFDPRHVQDSSLRLNGNQSGEVSSFTAGSSSDEVQSRLQQLEEYLTNIVEPNIANVENQVQGFGAALGTIDNRLTRLATASDSTDPSAVNARSFASHSSPTGIVGDQTQIDEMQRLMINVETLNASVAAQSFMLSEGFQQLGDYDRRLRQRERQDKLKNDELFGIKLLLTNATTSLSQMSMTIAEHQLTIPNIFDSLRVGDDILVDLNDQVFRHDQALVSLNRSLNSLEGLVAAAASSSSKSDTKQGQSSSQGDINLYASKDEFNGLGEALAGIAIRLRAIEITNTSRNSDDLIDVRNEMGQLRHTMALQRSAVADVSHVTENVARQVADVESFVARWRTSSVTPSGQSANSLQSPDLESLTGVVQNLKVAVLENRKILGNQRRRFKRVEDLRRTCARTTDVTMLNETISAEINSLHNVMLNVTSDMTSLSDKLPEVEDYKVLNDVNGDGGCVTMADVEKKLANLTRSVANLKLANFDPNAIDGEEEERRNLLEELRIVPSSLRILETQVQTFQDALVSLNQLRSKVNAMNGMRNLIFKNAADITSFHQTVLGVEKGLSTLASDISAAQAKQTIFESYQDDFRSQLNETRHRIDLGDDRLRLVDRALTVLKRSFIGNITEIKDRANYSKAQQDDNSRILAEFAIQIPELETNLQQESLTNTFRHNDANSRNSRFDRFFAELSEASLRHDRAVERLNQSQSEEKTMRTRTDADIEDSLGSLRESVLELEERLTDAQRVTSRQGQDLTQVNITSGRNTAEVQRLINSQGTSLSDIQAIQHNVRSNSNQMQLLNDRINNAEDGLTEARAEVTAQSNTLLASRQSSITMQDEINEMKQSLQRHDAFVRRAEHTIDKHRSDISSILEYSSNHTVAIERLKQRLTNQPAVSSSNTTGELLDEVTLLAFNLENTVQDLNTVKRTATLREKSAMRMNERITELSNSALEYQSKVRLSKESIDRLRNAVNRNSDRVRETERSLRDQSIAASDLQQVVVSNRNEITLLSNVRSSLEQLRNEFSRNFAVQDNRTRVLRTSHDHLNNRVASVRVDLDSHSRRLSTMRQDRLSLDTEIDQIYRSASNLEEILRKTVTDVQLLRRDLDDVTSTQRNVQTMNERTTRLQSLMRDMRQTVTTNENKISNVQITIETLSNSINRVIAKFDQRVQADQSRDQVRSNEIREVRNKLKTNSLLVRSAQNEIQRHNERLHVFTQRLNDVDRHAAKQPQTARSDEDLLEGSGWIPVQENKKQQSNVDRGSLVSVVQIDELITPISHRLDGLQRQYRELTDGPNKILLQKDIDLMEAAIQSKTIQVINNSVSELRTSFSLIALDLLDLTNRVDLFNVTHVSFMNQQLNDLATKLEKSIQSSNESCFNSTEELSHNVQYLQFKMADGFLKQNTMAQNFSLAFANLSSMLVDLRYEASTNGDVTNDDINVIKGSLSELTGEMESFLPNLSNISDWMMTSKLGLSGKGDVSHVHDDVVDLIHVKIGEMTLNMSHELSKLSNRYNDVIEQLVNISRSSADVQEDVQSMSFGNHSHHDLREQIQVISQKLLDLQTSFKVSKDQNLKVVELNSDRIDNISLETSRNKIDLSRLNELVQGRGDELNRSDATSALIAEELKDLKRRFVILESKPAPNNASSSSVPAFTWSPGVAQILTKLADDLITTNATIQNLLLASSKLEIPVDDVYGDEYVEGEKDTLETAISLFTSEKDFSDAVVSDDVTFEETVKNILNEMTVQFGTIISQAELALRSLLSLGSEERDASTTQNELSHQLIDVTTLTSRLDELEESFNRSVSLIVPHVIQPDLAANVTLLKNNVEEVQTEIRSVYRTLLQQFSLVSSSMRDEVNRLSANVLDHDISIFNMNSDISHFNNTAVQLVESLDLQELSLSNLFLTQEQLTSSITENTRLSSETSSRLTNVSSSIFSRIDERSNEIESRFLSRMDSFQSQTNDQQQSMMSDLIDVIVDVTELNQSLANAVEMSQDLRQEMRQQLQENRNDLQPRMERLTTRMNNLNQSQREIEISLHRTDIRADDLQSYVSNLLDVMRNETKHTVDGAIRSVELDTQQVMSLHAEQIAGLQDLTDRLAIVKAEDYARLNNLNATVRLNVDELIRLKREIENLSANDQNLRQALARSSMEMKGLGSKITASENLLETVSESMTRNGNQLTRLTGDLLSQGSQQLSTINLLSRMISNHTLEIIRLENKIKMLITDLDSRGSVRVVVPPVAPRPETTSATTTMTTTTMATTMMSTTSKTPTVPRPSGLNVISATETALFITWTPVVDPTVDGYTVTVQKVAGSHSSQQISAKSPPIQATRLDPGSRYEITVVAIRGQQLSAPLSGLGSTLPAQTQATTTSPVVDTSSTTATSTTSQTTKDPNAISFDADDSSRIADQNVLQCDFENENLCGFLDDTSDDFDWTRSNGSTPSSDTGPSTDHTLGNELGSYMFIEASRPRRQGDAASLVSPLLEPTNGQCLEFYHHLFGVGTGDLNVYVRPAGLNTRTKVWSETGSHGNQWKRARVTLRADAPFQLVFEAVRGSDYHADIAIDDIVVRQGPCPRPIIQCDFEATNLCGFIQDSDDDFDWDFNNGATSSADTGPIADHTVGDASGFYLYLEASNPRYPGDQARLSTPTLPPTNAQCLQFYYHMNGLDIGGLNVYLRQDSDPNNLGAPIWDKQGPQGNDWTLARATISSTDSFQVIFEGVRGDDFRGDIGLDDVLISDGHCSQPDCLVGLKFGDLCYKVEENSRNYQDASDACVNSGGILAAIKTQEQQDFLETLVGNYGNQWTLFWIGVNDIGVEGRFVYSDNSPMTFAAWTTDEPNDAIGDEDCVTMEFASKNRRWNDVPCNREQWYICQYPVTM